MFRSLVIGVVLAATLGSSPALAAPVPASPADRAMEARYTAAATAYWPGSPCGGRITVTYDTFPGALASDAAEYDRSQVTGVYTGDCHVILKTNLTDIGYCTALYHEFGHAAGRGHEPSGIMMPRVNPMGFQPCLDLMVAQPMIPAARSLLDLERNTHRGSQWKCSVVSIALVKCRYRGVTGLVRFGRFPSGNMPVRWSVRSAWAFSANAAPAGRFLYVPVPR